MFNTFTRTWWQFNKDYPGGLEPCPGERTYLESFDSEREARAFCREWNENHEPGPLSLKCEYEGV